MKEQMKSSGIDWIGNIPLDWNAKKVKYVISDIKDGTHGTFDRVESGELLLSAKNVFDDGIRIGENESEISILDYKSIISNGFPKRNDVLLCCVGTIGRCCVYEYDQSIAFQRSVAFLRPLQQTNARYLKYALQSDSTLIQEQFLINKSAQDGLYMGSVRELIIPYPNSKSEQQAIADFLDKECAQIDSITADLEKQIELLQQYKKSLITETVTKGLDKSVPMKDSGVEWIGKIPEHWQKTRIKFEASIIGSGTTPDSGNSMYYDNGEHSWIQSGDLYGKDYIYETEKQLTNLAILECHALNWYTKDFVVVAMYGASVGNVAISKIDSFTNQACCVIKLNEKNDNRYLFYFLKAAQEEMLLKAFGGTQPNISQIIIKNLNFLNVPLLEQIEIADFLDSKCDMINEMLKSKKDQYDILIKHKKSLIYEYVTGKKRVKEVQ